MNYTDAACRHFKDGEKLFTEKQYDNSDQLFGFAAECAIKSCLRSNCFQNGNIKDYHKVHINDLWERTLIHVDPRTSPTLITLLGVNHPYRDWHVKQRYEETGYVNQTICKNHRYWARRILGSIGLLGIRRNP